MNKTATIRAFWEDAKGVYHAVERIEREPKVRQRVLDHWKSYTKSPQITAGELRQYKKLLRHLVSTAPAADRVEALVTALNRIKPSVANYRGRVSNVFKRYDCLLPSDFYINKGNSLTVTSDDGPELTVLFNGPWQWKIDRGDSKVTQLADWRSRRAP